MLSPEGIFSSSFNTISSNDSPVEILESPLNVCSSPLQDVNVELGGMPRLCPDSPLLDLPLDNVIEPTLKLNHVINEILNQLEEERPIEN